MKVLFDYQAFAMQKFGGISRYFYELMKNARFGWDLPIRYSDNHYLQNFDRFRKQLRGLSDCYDRFFWGLNFRGKSRLFGLKNRLFSNSDCRSVNMDLSIRQLRQGDFDVFHPTYYDPYFLEFIGRKPFVLTIYDMIHEMYCEHFELTDPTLTWKRTLAKKAERIIVISENTKQDVMRFLGVDERKLKVIYLGSSFIPESPRGPGIAGVVLPVKYLLYVGMRTRYKNFYFFALSVAELLRSDRELRIVCAGEPFTDEEMVFLDNLGVKDSVLCIDPGDAGLAELYRNALAFVFPTLYEGFGIPVLESFACGCPALISRTSSLPEVGGGAVLYFDPKDPRDLRDKVVQLMSDGAVRKHLVMQGYEQLKKFSWEKATRETEKVYEEALGGA